MLNLQRENGHSPSAPATAARKVLLVGPGFRFLSGLSAYTCCLANSLTVTHAVSVLLLDRLVPKRLYPGADRVGKDLTALRYAPSIAIAGTVDWYWGAAIRHLGSRIRSESPDVIVLQWWTAATGHTYLLIVNIARRLRIPVIVEFHEAQDTGEAAVPMAARYGRMLLRRLVRRASGVIFHSAHDQEMITASVGADVMQGLRSAIAPHGPYHHLTASGPAGNRPDENGRESGTTRVLFFGLIRPYKGLEDLVAALDRMTDDEVRRLEVDIVGETWENWTAPAEAIRASRHRDRIRFDNRYVSDDEAAEYFANADVLVLPYRRGSASGPLQAAMSNGISVVLYAVGGLVEAVRDYPGATLVTPNDVAGLGQAILDVAARRSQRYANPHTWEPLRAAIDSFMAPDI